MSEVKSGAQIVVQLRSSSRLFVAPGSHLSLTMEGSEPDRLQPGSGFSGSRNPACIRTKQNMLSKQALYTRFLGLLGVVDLSLSNLQGGPGPCGSGKKPLSFYCIFLDKRLLPRCGWGLVCICSLLIALIDLFVALFSHCICSLLSSLFDLF